MSTTKKTKRVLTKNTIPETAEISLFIFSTSESRQQLLEAVLNNEIAMVKEKYNRELLQLSQQKLQAFETLQRYAENNRDAFGSKKSQSFKNGLAGFRTGMPKLKTLKGYSWNSVISLLKKHLPGYIRVVEEPAKDRLPSDQFVPEVQQKLAELSVYIEQDEVFYVEPRPVAQNITYLKN